MAVFTYPTVTISAVDYTVLVNLADADEYMAAQLGEAATAWAASVTAGTDDTRRAALNVATQMFDRMSWEGDRTDASNAHAHPRSDMTDREGEDVSSSTIAPDIVSGCIELAASLLVDASLKDRGEAAQGNVQSVGAGPASVTFFRPTTGTRMPRAVHELISPYLSSSGATSFGSAYGSDVCSDFEHDDDDDDVDYYGVDLA